MMDSTIVLDESSAELQIDLDSAAVATNANIEPEFPEESIEQLLLRSNSVIESAVSIIQKPATVQKITVRQLSTMLPPAALHIEIPPPNGTSRDMNESDDDVIFVGEHNTVINLCSPDSGHRTNRILFNESRGRLDSNGSAIQTTTKSVPVEKPVEKEPENMVICPVCMDSSVGRQPHSTSCGHIFCGICIKESIKMRKKCPLCNKTLTVKNIFPVFI